jgi:multisubunit Na+/H+ antiporter MnhG subunit
MAQNGNPPDKVQSHFGFSQALIGVFGKVGCLTLFLVIIPIVIGLLIDLHFNTQPIITIILVLVSFPVTMFLIYRVVLHSTAGLDPKTESQASEHEEVTRGGNP